MLTALDSFCVAKEDVAVMDGTALMTRARLASELAAFVKGCGILIQQHLNRKIYSDNFLCTVEIHTSIKVLLEKMASSSQNSKL